MIERLLRGMAIGIALLAFVDPPLTLAGRTRPRVAIVVQSGASMALPAVTGRETRREAARRIERAISERIGSDFDLVNGPDGSADAVVVIGDHYPDEPIAAVRGVSTVTVSSALTPNVRIAGVDAPAAVPPGTAVRLAVDVESSGVSGATTTLVVRTAGVEVGRAVHQWGSDSDTWRADVSVVPVGDPPFTFEISAVSLPSEKTTADNGATASVGVAPPLRVLVIEARPSWASAFVRRALEADSRFEVSGVLQTSPAEAVRTGAAPGLDPARLDAFDVVVAGGLDRLAPDTFTSLDRFTRERGGALVLLPDARVPDPVERRLLDGISLRETLLERPAALVTGSAPRLDASELLEATALPPGAIAIASSPASRHPVVWTIPRGPGRLLLSGAMDAWRFRAENDVEFDRFWRSLVSGLALDAAPAVAVELAPRRARVGDRVKVVARVRPLERDRLKDALSISARVGGETIRLWPDAPDGVFTGSFVLDAAHGQSPIVTATIGDGAASGSASIVVDSHAREAVGPPLSLLASTHGGVDTGPDDLAPLERQLRAAISGASTRSSRRPMRSPWWLVPFGAALSAEWWLRRRRGAR